MTSIRSLRAAHRGFTLLELMIVLVIIGVLISIVGFNLVGAADKAKLSATRTTMDVVKKGLSQYRAQYSIYPDTLTGLQVLVTEKILNELPKDGWGNLLEYYSPTPQFPSGFELVSMGPDLVSGTADDEKVTPDP